MERATIQLLAKGFGSYLLTSVRKSVPLFMVGNSHFGKIISHIFHRLRLAALRHLGSHKMIATKFCLNGSWRGLKGSSKTAFQQNLTGECILAALKLSYGSRWVVFGVVDCVYVWKCRGPKCDVLQHGLSHLVSTNSAAPRDMATLGEVLFCLASGSTVPTWTSLLAGLF